MLLQCYQTKSNTSCVCCFDFDHLCGVFTLLFGEGCGTALYLEALVLTCKKFKALLVKPQIAAGLLLLFSETWEHPHLQVLHKHKGIVFSLGIMLSVCKDSGFSAEPEVIRTKPCSSIFKHLKCLWLPRSSLPSS